MQCSFLFPCCPHPHQTQFFTAPGNGFNWKSDCNVCRLTARLVAAAKVTESLLPGSSNRGCMWAGRWLEAPCPSAEQGEKQRQKERKQSERSEENQQETTKPDGWVPASVGMSHSLKHFRSSFPKAAAHQGAGWESHRARPQVSSSPSAQVCSSAALPVTSPAVTAEPGFQAGSSSRQHCQVCMASWADVWHCLWEVLQDQLLDWSTSINKNVMDLPILQNPAFLPQLFHFFFHAKCNLKCVV